MAENEKKDQKTSDYNVSSLQIKACNIQSLLQSLDYAMAYISENDREVRYVPTFHDHLVLIEEKMGDLIRYIDHLELHGISD